MVSTTGKVKNEISKFAKKFFHAQGLINLNDEQIKQIAKSVLIDQLKAEFKNEIKKIEIDRSLEELKARWLNGFQSVHTRRSFKLNLAYFLNWLKGKSIAHVDAQTVDDYLIYLDNVKSPKTKKNISNNSKLQRIVALSSFWNKLVRWGIVSFNPFQGARKPKKIVKVKKAEQIPSERELNSLEQYAFNAIHGKCDNPVNTRRHQRAARFAYIAIKILREHGLRSGALHSLTIDSKRNFSADTKGSTINGILSNEILKSIEQLGLSKIHPFKNYTASAFATWLKKASKKVLGKSYLPHAIRHHFAVVYYKKYKDIVGLQIKLGHRCITSTETYLATLKNELPS